MGTAPTGSRLLQGEATRSRILKAAMDLASRHGLDSLTIGELAKELEMSKSGLFAHFGSKEELQIATIGAAEIVFGCAILEPAQSHSPGLCRLRAYLENYIQYLDDRVFPGGCFFSAAAAEYDDRPGRVRDRIVVSMRKWRDLLEEQAMVANQNGELLPDVDPLQLVFELKAFTHEANFNRQLLDDEDVEGRARRGIRDRLWNAASEAGRMALAQKLS
jgi:AcrR family transcriptional regulator